MAVFKVAFIGTVDENKINEIFEEWKNKRENSVELVDVSQMTPVEILANGPFQGVVFYNNIHDNKDFSDKLEQLISAQDNIKDTSLFVLTHDSVTPEKMKKEKENINSIYKKFFPDVNVDFPFASVNSEKEIESYFDVINSVSQIYINKVEKTETEIDKIYDDLTNSLEFAIQEKDTYTAGHVNRVSNYSVAIAQELGLSEEQVETVKKSAILHDIGKVVVKNSILKKASSLDDDEKKEMGEHTEQGVAFLRVLIARNPKLAQIITPEVLRGVEYHHKEWDGLHGQRNKPKEKQIPDEIRGDDIGIEALIIATADCLDAMSSQRAYNNPKHILDVFRDFCENKNHQFKPELSDAVIMLLAKEIAELGIDPLKLVPEYPENQDDSKLSNYAKKIKESDLSLKEFFESKKDDIKVNENPEKEAYSSVLGIRVDSTGHFEFKGKNSPKRDLAIPTKDKILYKIGIEIKDKKLNNINDLSEEEIQQIKKRVLNEIIGDEKVGKIAMERATVDISLLKQAPSIEESTQKVNEIIEQTIEQEIRKTRIKHNTFENFMNVVKLDNEYTLNRHNIAINTIAKEVEKNKENQQQNQNNNYR